MDLGKRLYNIGKREIQHRMGGGDDIDRNLDTIGPADILISFVIARLALQIPSVLINLSLIPLLPIANIGIRAAAQVILLGVKIAFDIVIVVYVAKIWGAKKKKEKEEEEAAEEAAAAFDLEGSYLVPPAQPSYQSKLSSTPSFYPAANNYPSSASSLWMHRGRHLGNTPKAIQGNPSAARQTFTA
jgi:hypothetical protein